MGWDYDYRVAGIALSDYCTAVVAEIEGGSGRDGVNIKIPGSDGERSIDKSFRPVSFPLRTILRWTGPGGTVTDANGEAGHIFENLSALKRLFGRGLVELSRSQPHAGLVIAKAELLDDPILGESRQVYVWPLRLVEGSWYEAELQEATGNPPIVVVGGDRRTEDIEIDFAAAAAITHRDSQGVVSSLTIEGTEGFPITVNTRDKTVVSSPSDLALFLHGSGWASTPDSAGLSFSVPLEIRARIAPERWEPSPFSKVIIAKTNPSDFTDREWILFLSLASNEGLIFGVYDGAGSPTHLLATPALDFADGSMHWIRVRVESTTTTWYISDDDTDDHTAVSWTQFHQNTHAAITIPTTIATELRIGRGESSLPSGTGFEGVINVMALLNNVTVVADPDFTDSGQWALGDTAGATGSDGTNTWTLAGDGRIGGEGSVAGRLAVNQPWWMRFDPAPDSQLLELSGGGQATTPDSVPLSITGDIDIRVLVAARDYTPGSSPADYQTLAAKWGPGQFSWSFAIRDAGDLLFEWVQGSVDQAISTVPIPAKDGQLIWLRVTFDVSVGGNHTVTFYTSDNGTTWSQLGAPVTDTGVVTMDDSNVVTRIGARGDGFEFDGYVSKAEIRNGIDGTVVASPDFTDLSQGWEIGDNAADTGVDDQGNVWTLVGDAEIVGGPQQLETSDTVTVRWRNRWA